MVHLYMADITHLPEQELELLNLPKERVQKIERQQNAEKKRQTLGAGLLLKDVLEKHGISQTEVRFGQYGKPEADRLCFNLSHSGNLVVCAVSDKPVGCDVEKVRKAPKGIAKRYFCENEYMYLETLEEAKYDTEFFRLWTMKESYVKMTGEGLRLPTDEFEMILSEEVKVLRDGEIQECFIKEYTVSGYRITVCAKECEFSNLLLMQLH